MTQTVQQVGVVVGGQVLPATVSIPQAGKLQGLTKGQSYRRARSHEWPVIGTKGQQEVALVPLLERLGIPYSFADEVPFDSE